MFKKTNRLTKSEFSEYFNKGTKKQFPHLTIITYPSNKTKIAVVVGKKVAKSAVRRNTLRRRAFAVVRKFETSPNHIGVLIVVLKTSFNTIPRKTAEELLHQSIAHIVKCE